MAKKKGQRILIGLKCSVCKAQNYVTEKNKLNTPDKLALNKFCNKCRKVTKHAEGKKLH